MTSMYIAESRLVRKTPKGVDEVLHKTHCLPLKRRQLLIMANGNTTIGELTQLSIILEGSEAALLELREQGYVEFVDQSIAEIKRLIDEKPPVAEPPTIPTPQVIEKPVAVKPAPAAIKKTSKVDVDPPTQTATDGMSLEQIKVMLLQQMRVKVGYKAEMMNSMFELCRTRQDLAKLLIGCYVMLEKHLGKATAEAVTQKFKRYVT